MSTKKHIIKLPLKDQLLKITGIGPKQAEILLKKIKKYDDLYKESIYKSLPIASQAYLKYKPIDSISRTVIDKFSKIIKKMGHKAVISGSYRRGKPTSGDIDLIVQGISWEEIQDFLTKNKYVLVPPYSIGLKQLSSYIKLGKHYVQIDIFRATTDSEYMFMLLYSTGSRLFNIRMRSVAKHRGYVLNQYGLFDSNGKQVELKTEKEVFKFLGITWKEPSERNK